MKNLEKRDFCVNTGCPSNNPSGDVVVKPKIIHRGGLATCGVCEYASKDSDNSSAVMLYSYLKDYVGEENV